MKNTALIRPQCVEALNHVHAEISATLAPFFNADKSAVAASVAEHGLSVDSSNYRSVTVAEVDDFVIDLLRFEALLLANSANCDKKHVQLVSKHDKPLTEKTDGLSFLCWKILNRYLDAGEVETRIRDLMAAGAASNGANADGKPASKKRRMGPRLGMKRKLTSTSSS